MKRYQYLQIGITAFMMFLWCMTDLGILALDDYHGISDLYVSTILIIIAIISIVICAKGISRYAEAIK